MSKEQVAMVARIRRRLEEEKNVPPVEKESPPGKGGPGDTKQDRAAERSVRYR